MSSRHYWPEPKHGVICQYLVEHKEGEVREGVIDSNGTWNIWPLIGYTVEQLSRFGYLGVRKPFDEEAERVAFEAYIKTIWVSPAVLKRRESGDYTMDHIQFAWRAWLAAKRYERGL